MISFIINFLMESISKSHFGAQIIIIGAIIVLVGMAIVKLSKVLPVWYQTVKAFILNRERKREEAESTQQKILSNQDSILNNYKNVESLNKSVADLAKLTNKISDEYRQISGIMEEMLNRIALLEDEVPELRKISDNRDNELIVTIKNQTIQLTSINQRIEEIAGMVTLLNDSDTEKFRHKLMEVYERSIMDGNKIELHTYQDLYKGFQRYQKQGGNSYAEDVWGEISKCQKVIEHPELYPHKEMPKVSLKKHKE